MTRRITLNPSFGSNKLNYVDFENDWIIVKDGDHLQEFKAARYQPPYKNYSVQQIEAICKVNNVLEQNNQQLMTEEEIEYLLYPFGKEKPVDAVGLQALAGFRIEKTITSI